MYKFKVGDKVKYLNKGTFLDEQELIVQRLFMVGDQRYYNIQYLTLDKRKADINLREDILELIKAKAMRKLPDWF